MATHILCTAAIVASSFAQPATAANSSTHLKWRTPTKDNPWQGTASAMRKPSVSAKVKWQPYRTHASNPVERVSTAAKRVAEELAVESPAEQPPSDAPPAVAPPRTTVAKTSINPEPAQTSEQPKKLRAAKSQPTTESDRIEGPSLKLVQFDDPFEKSKPDDSQKKNPFGAPTEATKPPKAKASDKPATDPFGPPTLEEHKPAELPSKKPTTEKPTDMSPPEFGPPADTKDKPSPFDLPMPNEEEPLPMPEIKQPETKQPAVKQPAEKQPERLNPQNKKAQPIKMTAGYAEVLRTVEERLAKGSLRKIDLDIAVSGQPDKDVPRRHEIEDETYEQRNWALTTYMWKASALCHKPLYFEQTHVERYGHAWNPYLEPVLEGAHFFASVPLLPYKMGLQPPHECVYALGYYRPGSCAPYLLDPLPISLRGALFEGAAIGLGVSLLP